MGNSSVKLAYVHNYMSGGACLIFVLKGNRRIEVEVFEKIMIFLNSTKQLAEVSEDEYSFMMKACRKYL